MVKDLFKKVRADWPLWILLYGVKFFNISQHWLGLNPSGERILSYSVTCLQVALLSLIMLRWKLPVPWLVIFASAAIIAQVYTITSVTNVGLLVLFLGYYYLEKKVQGGNAID
jgi:hypothetical protein